MIEYKFNIKDNGQCILKVYLETVINHKTCHNLSQIFLRYVEENYRDKPHLSCSDTIKYQCNIFSHVLVFYFFFITTEDYHDFAQFLVKNKTEVNDLINQNIDKEYEYFVFYFPASNKSTILNFIDKFSLRHSSETLFSPSEDLLGVHVVVRKGDYRKELSYLTLQCHTNWKIPYFDA